MFPRPQWATRHDGESLLGLGDRRKNAPGTVRFICSRQLPSWLYVVTLIHFSSSHHSKLHFPPQSSTGFEFIWRLHCYTNPILNRVTHLCKGSFFSVRILFWKRYHHILYFSEIIFGTFSFVWNFWTKNNNSMSGSCCCFCCSWWCSCCCCCCCKDRFWMSN